MEDHAYFLAIEETFIRLRGAPLMLSADDWQIASRWNRRGIPLDVVLEALEGLFRRRRERGRDDPVTLRYCAPVVERSWKKIEGLGDAARRGTPAELDVGELLASLAERLPEGLPGGRELRSRITGLSGDHQQIEAALAEIDRELLRRAEGSLETATRERLEAKAAAAARRAGERLPAAELEAARDRLYRRLIRRELGLPVLSLFAASS